MISIKIKKMKENTQETVKGTSSTQVEPVEAQPVTHISDELDAEKNKGMAILSYFIFFIPMLTDAKDSKFAMFHANQSLVLWLVGLVVSIVGTVIPILGWFIILPFGTLFVLILWIMGIINASEGKMKELPLVGEIHILDKA